MFVLLFKENQLFCRMTCGHRPPTSHQLSVNRAEANPCLPRMGDSFPEIPWSRTPGSTHSSVTHKNGFYWREKEPVSQNGSPLRSPLLRSTTSSREQRVTSTSRRPISYSKKSGKQHWWFSKWIRQLPARQSLICHKKEQREILTESLEAREDSVSQIVKICNILSTS